MRKTTTKHGVYPYSILPEAGDDTPENLWLAIKTLVDGICVGFSLGGPCSAPSRKEVALIYNIADALFHLEKDEPCGACGHLLYMDAQHDCRACARAGFIDELDLHDDLPF